MSGRLILPGACLYALTRLCQNPIMLGLFPKFFGAVSCAFGSIRMQTSAEAGGLCGCTGLNGLKISVTAHDIGARIAIAECIDGECTKESQGG